MSISSTTSRNNYTGNDTASVFAYSFRILDDDHLLVTVRDSVGTETTLVKTTDYTVSGVGSASGSITLVNASQAWLTAGTLATGYEMSIVRSVPLTQPTDIRNQGEFYPETHEDMADRIVMQNQRQQDDIDRGIRLPVTVDPTTFDPEIPAAIVGEAGAVLKVNSDGDGWTLGTTDLPSATTTPYTETLLDDLNAAAARATLGATGTGDTWDTAQIDDLAITAAKLASDAVTTAKILDANVTAVKIAEAVRAAGSVYGGASAAGTDTYAVTPSPAFTAYATGMTVTFKADVANTGAATLNVNALGAKSLKVFTNGSKSNPTNGAIPAGGMVIAIYDGTDFIVSNVAVAPFSAYFESSEQALTGGTNYTAAHGLGAVPRLWKVVLRCKTTDGGYAVGDEVEPMQDGGSASSQMSAYADATNIGFTIDAAIFVAKRSATVGSAFSLTLGNWRAVMRAWN